jgi:ABC-2 type transport system permease protein
MMQTLLMLVRKEFLQILRDRIMPRMLLVMPLVQLIILSSAATFEVRSARVYVVDHDRTDASRGLVTRLQASGRFRLVDASPSMTLANDAMLAGDAGMILAIPADFERALVRQRQATVQLVLNAEDGAAAGVTQAYASQIIRAYATELGAESAPATVTGVVDVAVRGWYNPTLDYRDYMVPGILVMLVTIIGTLLTAMNIVREKEIGTLEQLSVTPLSRTTFIAAKLIPLWIIAVLELVLGLILVRIVFGIPVLGNPVVIFIAASIYLLAALGIGLWVSTVAHTQQQAMFITFFMLMTYLLMSGLFTPVRSMPDWAQWIAEANPLKHFVLLMRAVMLKGAGLADVARELLALAALSGVALAMAIRQYGKTA